MTIGGVSIDGQNAFLQNAATGFLAGLYLQFGAVNRFLGIDGQSRERLVVTPGQFRASGATSPVSSSPTFPTGTTWKGKPPGRAPRSTAG